MQPYKTSPEHWLDRTLWPVLKLTWEHWGRAISHFWHWRNYQGPIEFPLVVPGDPKAGDRSKHILADLFYSNFGWKQAFVLVPASHTEYQIGFSAKEGKKQVRQLCSIILTGPTAVLQGAYRTDFFALAYPSGESVKLSVIWQTTKSTLKGDIPLI